MPDVHAFPGHIACDSASESELVVPLMQDGRVIGAGTHEALLAQSPTYREFAESQSMDAEVGGTR